jgi:DNA (cytosine-5)-methyltransferase 1
MALPKAVEPIQRPNYADLFCGAGGFSKGVVEAMEEQGMIPLGVVCNHWDIAIKTHTNNHPDATHICDALENVDPHKYVPADENGVRRLRLLVASPECTHHSNARGDKPMDDQSRSSAWDLCRWLQKLYVDDVIIENVPEFRTWGPLGLNNRPLKSKRGQLFYQFLKNLRALGYRYVEWKILCCADYGDPTKRKRLFIIARRNKPIKWPEPTHRDPRKLEREKRIGFNVDHIQPWRTTRDWVIDWDLTGTSIFNRKKPLAMKTLKRIEAGLVKFGGPNKDPFLIILRRHMDAISIDEPLPTLTAGGNHIALVEVLEKENSDLEPAQPSLIEYRGGVGREPRVSSVDEALKTQDCSNRFGLAEPTVINLKGQSDGADIDAPLPTNTTQPHLYLCEHDAMIIGNGGPGGSGKPQSVDEPLGTVLAQNHRSLVEFIVPHPMFQYGKEEQMVDSVDEPLRTLTAQNARAFKLCEACIVPQFGERDGQTPRCHSVDDPLPAVTSHGAGALVEGACIVDVNHGNGGDPKGDERRTQSVDEPLATVTSARRGKALASFVTVANGCSDAVSVDAPLPAVSTKQRFAIVECEGRYFAQSEDGEMTVELDIRLRMLQWHELARAMSLDGYKFAGTNEQIVRQIGNAVPRRTARALARSVLN